VIELTVEMLDAFGKARSEAHGSPVNTHCWDEAGLKAMLAILERDNWVSPKPTPEQIAAGTKPGDPRSPASEAVYAHLRANPPRTGDLYEKAIANARVWKAVNAALDAMGVPNVPASELYPMSEQVAPGTETYPSGGAS
jgi:hypothetical protein